jgi:hypothetical protein
MIGELEEGSTGEGAAHDAEEITARVGMLGDVIVGASMRVRGWVGGMAHVDSPWLMATTVHHGGGKEQQGA